jgi:hypothetical protein
MRVKLRISMHQTNLSWTCVSRLHYASYHFLWRFDYASNYISFFLSYKECIVNLRQVVCLDLDINQVPKKLSLDGLALYDILFLLREWTQRSLFRIK